MYCRPANNAEDAASTAAGWPRRPGRAVLRSLGPPADPTSGRQGQSCLLTTARTRRDVLAAQPLRLRQEEVMKLVSALVLGLCLAAPVRAAEDVPITSKSPEARALVKSALSHIDNVHIGEAVAALKKAIDLDPDLATAHALLAALSPPDEAKKEIALAQRDVRKLPEAERVQIEALAAGIAGDNAKARDLQVRLAEVAPGDFRAHNTLGTTALGDRDFKKAQAEFEKAI